MHGTINIKDFLCRNSPNRNKAALLLRFLDHTQLDIDTHTHILPVGLSWTSVQFVTESAQHNTQKRRKSIAVASYEPAILASKQSQNYALDHTSIRIGHVSLVPTKFHVPTSNYLLYIANRILDSKQSPYFDRSYMWRPNFSQDIPSFSQKILYILYSYFLLIIRALDLFLYSSLNTIHTYAHFSFVVIQEFEWHTVVK